MASAEAFRWWKGILVVIVIIELRKRLVLVCRMFDRQLVSSGIAEALVLG
jgi:hypothetical protein